MAPRTTKQKTKSLLTRAAFERERPLYDALREEVVFILGEAIAAKGIKVHSVESRVKEYESLLRKIEEGSGETSRSINDIVGARVICLFKSDLDTIKQVISENFDVQSTDDKISASPDSFGYMSIHQICKMKGEYVGPRYDKIRHTVFEIQIRTLCMHAWAAISHYLDYKAEWDIPDHLKKGLNALSGLFYVADEQYEALFKAREASRESAGNVSMTSTSATPINLDTLQAWLNAFFPKRGKSNSEYVSKLVRDLLETGYEIIEDVERDVRSASEALAKNETAVLKKEKRPGPLFYTDVGAARVSLRSANSKFGDVSSRNFTLDLPAPS